MSDADYITTTFALVGHLTGKKINMPTAEGLQLGEIMAKRADEEMARRKANFPNHVERCDSCAFRKGTIPNGSPATLLDALSCIAGNGEFYCHERENHQCVGYAILATGAG